jgi:hypothetical protein
MPAEKRAAERTSASRNLAQAIRRSSDRVIMARCYAPTIAGTSAPARFSTTRIGVARSRSSSSTWRSSRK